MFAYSRKGKIFLQRLVEKRFISRSTFSKVFKGAEMTDCRNTENRATGYVKVFFLNKLIPVKDTPEAVYNPYIKNKFYTFGYGPADGAVDPGFIKINRFLLEDEEKCQTAYPSVSFTGAICTIGIVPEPTDTDQYQTPQNAVSKVRKISKLPYTVF